MKSLQDHLRDIEQRQVKDAETFNALDPDKCMLCHATGPDMRSLLIRCLYDIQEVIPESLATHQIEDFKDFKGYYLRICKCCRGELLGHLEDWNNDALSRRAVIKDSDGYEWYG